MDQNSRTSAETPREREVIDSLLMLSERIRTMARELASSDDGARAMASVQQVAGCFNDQLLAAVALSIYRARQRRVRYFDPQLFGEPAWDVLLELFINKTEGVQLSTSSVCLAAGVPATTALRTLEKIEKQGLARRFRNGRDRRLLMVELTDLGFKLVRSYLSEGILREEMPLPGDLKAA